MSNGPPKQYVAEATSAGVEVLIQHSSHPGDTTRLDELPGGYEWGYEGTGPLRLAYAILGNAVAERFSQAFMEEVISQKSPIEKHEQVVVFKETEILKWLKDQLNKCDLCA